MRPKPGNICFSFSLVEQTPWGAAARQILEKLAKDPVFCTENDLKSAKMKTMTYTLAFSPLTPYMYESRSF
jgi:hypothetical protein